MSGYPNHIRALHIHDAAMVGRNLVDMANELGQPWRMTGIPWYYTRQWSGALGHLVKRTRPAVWDATLALESARSDVVHIHTGGLGTHARWLRTPWVLHLHGTDVRTRQYEGGWHEKLLYGASNASAVVYATPDLRSHTLNLRSDASYLPISVRLDQAPPWRPRPNRVIFASRWSQVKGGEDQLDVARRLRRERPDIELRGLDWGENAEKARTIGVILDPKMSYVDYRSWLATASVVVGQMTSILATSELEALSIGVPLVSSFNHHYYPELTPLSADNPASVTAAVLNSLGNPQNASSVQDGPGFIGRVHDAKVGVTTLLDLYATVIEERR